MRALWSNMPKWLLAFVVAGILTGYHQQAGCKLTGCESSVAAQSDGADHSEDSAPQSGDQHCQCQCHLVALSLYELPAAYVGLVRAASTLPPGWVAGVPEAPCADIEHPPQLG